MFYIEIVDFDILNFCFFFFSPCFPHLVQPDFLTDFIVSVEVLPSFVWICTAFLFLALLRWGGYPWILYAPTHLADRLRIRYTDFFLPRMFPRVILQSSTTDRWSASLWKSRLTCHIPWKQETTLTQWSLYCVSAGIHLNLSMSLWGDIELWGVY